jgi:acyl-CoA thioester hydrolase
MPEQSVERDSGGPVETFRGMAHPWHCDSMGHMNVRFYMGMFDDAAFHLLALIGGDVNQMAQAGQGWADVQHKITYKQEVRAGTLLVVRSSVTRVGRSSITSRHDMSDALSGALIARAETVTALFDLAARQAMPLPDAFRSRAGGVTIEGE